MSERDGRLSVGAPNATAIAPTTYTLRNCFGILGPPKPMARDAADAVGPMRRDYVTDGDATRTPLRSEMTAKAVSAERFEEWPAYDGGPSAELSSEERLFDRRQVAAIVDGAFAR